MLTLQRLVGKRSTDAVTRADSSATDRKAYSIKEENGSRLRIRPRKLVSLVNGFSILLPELFGARDGTLSSSTARIKKKQYA
jgi:hypothetical protein